MASPSKSSWKHDPIHGLRGFLVLDAIIRLLVWGGSIFLTLWVVRRLGLWPATTPTGGPALEESTVWWRWTLFSVQFIIWFNVIYAALLILLRLPIPRPHEGRYRITPGAPIAKDLIWSCLIATLTKARYDAPFPAIFVFHAMNLPPLVWIAARVFGPRSKSCYITEPQIIDPHMVTIGRNVVIGFGSIVAGHYQEQEEIVIRRTIIEDDVLIGGGVLLSGSHIKKGSIVGAGSVVLPGTVTGESEYWSGNPARRRSKLAATEASPEPETVARIE